MNIALLNVRITIQKNHVTVDEIGNHIVEWEDYFSCHATPTSGNRSPREDQAAATIVENSDMNFTVRWCNTMAPVDSDHYRVIFDGEIYNILGIDMMNFKKKSIKLRCQKARR